MSLQPLPFDILNIDRENNGASCVRRRFLSIVPYPSRPQSARGWGRSLPALIRVCRLCSCFSFAVLPFAVLPFELCASVVRCF